MEPNFLILPLTALIPLVVGAIYYNPAVFGKIWMNASGVTEEQAQSGNMLKIFGLTYIFSLMMGLVLIGLTIHQNALQSLLFGVEGFGVAGSEVQTYFDDFMKQYGNVHRTFGHGVVHGVIAGVFLAWPLIGVISLFERKSWKYIGVHTLYWIISLALMGGVICKFV